MNLELFVANDDNVRNLLIKEFGDSPIEHGTSFDDRRRWCVVCKKAQLVCEPIESNIWADKTCSACMSLWPEFIEMVVDSVLYDEDFADTLNDYTVN
jgi:hypothetical protein